MWVLGIEPRAPRTAARALTAEPLPQLLHGLRDVYSCFKIFQKMTGSLAIKSASQKENSENPVWVVLSYTTLNWLITLESAKMCGDFYFSSFLVFSNFYCGTFRIIAFGALQYESGNYPRI